VRYIPPPQADEELHGLASFQHRRLLYLFQPPRCPSRVSGKPLCAIPTQPNRDEDERRRDTQSAQWQAGRGRGRKFWNRSRRLSRLAHAEGAHVVMVSRSPDRLEEARSCDPVHDDKHVPDRHRTAGGRRPRHRHVNGVRRVVGITRRYTPTHRFTVVARSTANFYRASSDRFLALRG